MSAQLVPTIKTQFSHQDLVKSLILVWRKLYGEIPNKKQIGVIFAQWSIETGQGKYCWNNNIGNVKYTPSKNTSEDDNKQYMMLNNVWEIIDGKKVIYQPPHAATWFRSFPSLDEGVEFHINFLKNKRYKTAWKAVEEGDPAKFAHLLKESNYYTAPESDYIKNMNFYFNRFMKDQMFDQVILQLQQPAQQLVGNFFTKFIEKLK